MALLRSSVVLLLLSVHACSGEDPEPSMRCFLGDPGEEPVIEVVYRTLEGSWALASPGSEVPLILPPQGFRVLLIGARARNLDGCGLQMTGSLVDEASGEFFGTEQRPVMLVPSEDGWLVPDRPHTLSNYANVSACPNPEAPRDLFDEPFTLRVRVRDVDGRMAEASVPAVIPRCSEPGQESPCRCECRRGYVLGQSCERNESESSSVTARPSTPTG